MDISNTSRRNKFRFLAGFIIILLLLPTAVAGMLSDGSINATETAGVPSDVPTEDVTFVTTQGKEYTGSEARLVAFDSSAEPVWVHDKYSRYFDVNPIENNRLLFVASTRQISDPKFSGEMIAVVLNWRTGEVHDRFQVPNDAHDVDYLGSGKYAVADKENDRAYVFNRTADKMTAGENDWTANEPFSNNSTVDETPWEYKFENHFSDDAGGPSNDWTHLNDIDSVDNGSAFLLSPRNFDRVMLVNRSTKTVNWTLGEEDNYDVLNEQHNPSLVSQSPRTVLVADSENNRVVEYRYTDDGWVNDWAYTNLTWVREADRLPNGNTIMAVSGEDRAIEVTPNGEVVWEASIGYSPYDIERPEFGDEPTGQTMHEMGIEGRVIQDNPTDSGPPSTLDRLAESFAFIYETAQWVIPSWIGRFEFALLALIPVVALGWAGIEISHARRARSLANRFRDFGGTKDRLKPFLAVASLLVGVVLSVVSVTGRFTTLSLGVSLLLFLEATNWLHHRNAQAVGAESTDLLWVIRAALALAVIPAVLALLTLATQAVGELTEVYVGLAVLLAISALR